MASSLRSPETFNFSSGDLSSAWKLWSEQVKWYVIATKSENTLDVQLVGTLITLLGAEGLKIYKTFTWTRAGDAENFDVVLAKFDEHFAPRRSEVFERFKFMKRSQAPGESFDTWLVDMKALADSCNYGDGLNSIIRDFIVLGVEDDNTREKLLYETGLTLAKAIEICRACESAKSHLSKIASQPSPANVHAVGYRKPSNSQQNHPSTSGNQSSSGAYKGNHPQCNKCGWHHKSGECRAGNIKCYKCDGMGHYAKFCTGKDKSLQIKSVAAVQSVEETVQLVEETAFNPAFGSDFMVIHTLHALKKEKKTVVPKSLARWQHSKLQARHWRYL